MSNPPALKIATLNVRGLRSNLQDVLQLIETQQPDEFILTETKLTRKSRRSATQGLCGLGYRQYHSTAQHDRGRAGVSILVKDHIKNTGLLEVTELPAPAHGYLKSII
jgi:exonuclease III